MSRHSIAVLMGMFTLIGPGIALANGPATRPVVKVAVVAFDVLGEAGHEWVGRAMQEGLANGIQTETEFQAVPVAGLGPFDAGSAAAAGKSAGADFVVFGSVQFMAAEMRIAGQIVDVNSGQSLGKLRSDADSRDLFTVEDVLARRVGRILAPTPAIAAAQGSTSFELVGPSLTPQTPRYFDGNLKSILTPPQRFRDEYDRYYYYSSTTCGYPFCGWGNCWLGGWCFGFGNPWFFPTSVPQSGW